MAYLFLIPEQPAEATSTWENNLSIFCHQKIPISGKQQESKADSVRTFAAYITFKDPAKLCRSTTLLHSDNTLPKPIS